jgi:hypothetical protein
MSKIIKKYETKNKIQDVVNEPISSIYFLIPLMIFGIQ